MDWEEKCMICWVLNVWNNPDLAPMDFADFPFLLKKTIKFSNAMFYVYDLFYSGRLLQVKIPTVY